MNKYIYFTLCAACLSILAAASGCKSAANTNSSANTNTSVNLNANKPVENANKTETANANTSGSTGSLATPTEAYNTAYALRQKKHGPGLKKVLSKDLIEFFTEIGKADKKSLDDMLKELAEKPQGPSNETRNEKITGDTAVLEYKDEKGEWKEMDFIKEGGEWKLTMAKADKTVTDGPPKKP